jgi:hypothetical protein
MNAQQQFLCHSVAYTLPLLVLLHFYALVVAEEERKLSTHQYKPVGKKFLTYLITLFTRILTSKGKCYYFT